MHACPGRLHPCREAESVSSLLLNRQLPPALAWSSLDLAGPGPSAGLVTISRRVPTSPARPFRIAPAAAEAELSFLVSWMENRRRSVWQRRGGMWRGAESVKP